MTISQLIINYLINRRSSIDHRGLRPEVREALTRHHLLLACVDRLLASEECNLALREVGCLGMNSYRPIFECASNFKFAAYEFQLDQIAACLGDGEGVRDVGDGDLEGAGDVGDAGAVGSGAGAVGSGDGSDCAGDVGAGTSS